MKPVWPRLRGCGSASEVLGSNWLDASSTWGLERHVTEATQTSAGAELPATVTADGLAFHIEPALRALWYEIVTP